jgi:glycosyltransferase involved in cell wall biosynthesis
VLVSIDGHPVAVTAVNVPRPDVVAALGLAASELECGWKVTIELQAALGDTINVSAAAWMVDGRLLDLGAASAKLIGHRQPRTRAHIDVPVTGATVPPTAMWIQGWAMFPDGAPASVELRLNGGAPHRARTGVARPDVGLEFPPWGSIAGFEEILDIGGLSPGQSLTIDATAVAMDGTRATVEPVVVVVGSPADVVLPADADRAAVLRSRIDTSKGGAAADGIRVAVFTHDLGYGGGQLYLHQFLRCWSREPGFSAAVVAPRDGPLRAELEELGIEVNICGRYPASSVDAYEGRVRALVDWARPQGFNLAFANTMLASIGADAALRMGLPVVWGIHESFDWQVYWELANGDGTHPYVKVRARDALRRAALVAFEAAATQALYQSMVTRAATLAYGVDLAAIDEYLATADRDSARAGLGFAPGETVLLCLGTMEPRKGQAALAQAFLNVSPAHPEATLVFVGDNGSPSAEALRTFIDSMGAGDRIRMLPVTGEIYPWYLAADLLVNASDVESLPRSALEAMAFRVPVLGTDVFGMPELIEDGVTGFLCPARDTAALAAALDRVLSMDAAAVSTIAAAGSELVRSKHDVVACAAEYLRRMRALVETGPVLSPP